MTVGAFLCLKGFIDGPEGGFQGFQLLIGAGADHLDNGLLEVIGAIEGGTDKLGNGFLPGLGDVHFPNALPEPGLIDAVDPADVGDCAVAGFALAFLDHPDEILGQIQFFAKSALRKAAFFPYGKDAVCKFTHFITSCLLAL